MSSNPPSGDTSHLEESDLAVLWAIECVLDGMNRASGQLEMSLGDTGVFEIADPKQESIPFETLWDLGTLVLLDRCLWFTSDIAAFAIRVEDIQAVRIGGEVAVLTMTRPTGAAYHLGLGGYRAYAELICILVEAVRDEHSWDAVQASLELLRDSVLGGSSV